MTIIQHTCFTIAGPLMLDRSSGVALPACMNARHARTFTIARRYVCLDISAVVFTGVLPRSSESAKVLEPEKDPQIRNLVASS